MSHTSTIMENTDISAPPEPQGRKADLSDSFGRKISYVRLSVTDRCDLRCTYCMAEDMVFLPKKEVLTLEEMITLSDAFIERGVDKIRLTGGEPLVRKGIETLIEALGQRVKAGLLKELTLTTNGTQLARFAPLLADAGVRRVNVSLDTLDADTFRKVTRLGDIDKVLDGIKAAQDTGLRVKINTVALNGVNDQHIPAMIRWVIAEGLDISLIETMPLGNTGSDRVPTFLPLTAYLDGLKREFDLIPSLHKTGGPSRYYDIGTSGSRLGVITPLTNNFCATCNRVRVTATGRIYMCLGQDDHIDLRAALRGDNREADLEAALNRAMQRKPKAHDFAVSDGEMTGTVGRHMSMTGG